MVEPQHQAVDAVLGLQGSGRVDPGDVGGRQRERLVESDRSEIIVEVDVDVPDTVVGEVGQERERQVREAEEPIALVALAVGVTLLVIDLSGDSGESQDVARVGVAAAPGQFAVSLDGSF